MEMVLGKTKQSRTNVFPCFFFKLFIFIKGIKRLPKAHKKKQLQYIHVHKDPTIDLELKIFVKI